MSQRLDLRLDKTTAEKLDLLIAKTGENKTEIIKDLVNNARASDFKMVAKSDEDIKREIKLVATRKYLIILYRNATNNLNQIAHVLNKFRNKQFDHADAVAIEKAFFNLKNAMNKLTEKVKEVDKND